MTDHRSDVDESRRIKLKEAATLRAQFNYETSMRRIDHKLDVIEPRLKEVVKQLTEHGELSSFELEAGEIDGGA